MLGKLLVVSLCACVKIKYLPTCFLPLPLDSKVAKRKKERKKVGKDLTNKLYSNFQWACKLVKFKSGPTITCIQIRVDSTRIQCPRPRGSKWVKSGTHIQSILYITGSLHLNTVQHIIHHRSKGLGWIGNKESLRKD